MKYLHIKRPLGVLMLLAVLLAFAPAPTSAAVDCTALTRNLYFGSRDYFTGGEVTKLQVFLSEEGYFNPSPTGYFGGVTFASVKRFQRDHNIITTGFVGPLTRAEIQRVSCGGGITSNLNLNYLTPTSGSAGTSVTIYGSGFTDNNLVTFGNGAAGRYASSNGGTVIAFSVPNALNPRCYYSNPPCLTFAAAQRTVPGNYDVTVINSNGESNKLVFTVTSNTNNSVSISGIDAPSQLRVGQSGTWALHATDSSTGSSLSYSVLWGDESYYPYAMNASQANVSQSATFTHTYNYAGTFTPKFTVTNNAGASANVSSSVSITSY
ncbi:MAG: peptidoglycan-binding protein [Patescibacteria group bacterium]